MNYKNLCLSMSLASSLVISACGPTTTTTKSELQSGSIGKPCPTDPKIVTWVLQPLMRDLNRLVHSYAQYKLGKHVGNGDSYILAAQAAGYAGAVPFYRLGPTGANADYVWGRVLFPTTAGHPKVSIRVRPGDILQVRNAHLNWHYKDATGQHSQTYDAVHHTMIVSAVSTDRRQLCVIQQDYPQGSPVHYTWLSFTGSVSGAFRFYRPLR